MRFLLSTLGFISVGCGVVGLFLPVWPSTVFFIIAAALFAKSNPRAEKWLLDHPAIGPGLRLWREQKAISNGAKIMATIVIAVTFAFSIYFVSIVWLKIALVVFALGLIAFICTRPSPKKELPFTETVKGNDAA
ncbi:MAG: YbaN family protein [Fimbriimonadales bacterium]